MKKKVHPLIIVGVFSIMAWLMYGKPWETDDNNNGHDQASSVSSSEGALRFLNDYNKWNGTIPGGKFKLLFQGNTVSYWEKKSSGWPNSSTATCTFTINRKIESVDYMGDIKDVVMFEIEVDNDCWKSDMKSVLRMRLSADGANLYIRDCYSGCWIMQGWN